MFLINKLKDHGWLWLVRRVAREFVTPTTSFGKRLKPYLFVFYIVFNKPVNYIYFLAKLRSKSKDSLYFFYDFEVAPITYDFAWALCIANARREELGLAYLRIIFVPGTEDGLRKESVEYEQFVGCDARNWRIYSILLPVIKLLPHPISFMFCRTRNEALLIKEQQAHFVYPEQYNVIFPISYSPEKWMDYQPKFLALQADNQAIEYVSQWLFRQANNKKVIVITLRQYGYTPERNSNIEAWGEFARKLDDDEFFIVFVPDVEQALNNETGDLPEFHFFYPACWNLSLRAALYELAYLNLGVNTGPMALCWLNPRCRYITFKPSIKNVPHASIEVLIERGFVPDENPLFAKPFQKWVWAPDNLDIISREFLLMYDSINGGNASDGDANKL